MTMAALDVFNVPYSLSLLGSTVIILIGFIAIKALRVGSRPKGLPPGPPTEFIWGNTKQVHSPRVCEGSCLRPNN